MAKLPTLIIAWRFHPPPPPPPPPCPPSPAVLTLSQVKESSLPSLLRERECVGGWMVVEKPSSSQDTEETEAEPAAWGRSPGEEGEGEVEEEEGGGGHVLINNHLVVVPPNGCSPNNNNSSPRGKVWWCPARV